MIIDVYTDGSCQSTHGGYAFLFIHQQNIIFKNCNYVENTTNNQMEMQGLIAAMEQLLKMNYEKHVINVFSDSNYSIEGINKWIYRWHHNNWQTAKKSPVKNQEYWIKLYQLKNHFHNISFKWVHGHSDNIYNNMADKMARNAAAQLFSK